MGAAGEAGAGAEGASTHAGGAAEDASGAWEERLIEIRPQSLCWAKGHGPYLVPQGLTNCFSRESEGEYLRL